MIWGTGLIKELVDMAGHRVLLQKMMQRCRAACAVIGPVQTEEPLTLGEGDRVLDTTAGAGGAARRCILIGTNPIRFCLAGRADFKTNRLAE
jgi:hypothetical protein